MTTSSPPKPEYIFQNHVHLDQMRHASRITTATGAKLVGAQEHCAFTKRDAEVKGLSGTVNCVAIRDSQGNEFTGGETYGRPPVDVLWTPFGTIGKPDEMPPGVDVKVGNEGHNPDVSPYARTGHPAVAARLRHDAGLRGRQPAVRVQVRRLHAGPPRVVGLARHHGNWNPPATAAAAGYYGPWSARIARIPADRRPELCFIVEANRGMAFSIKTSEWAGDNVGQITPIGKPGCYTG